eukprot:jgi/Tetstr1/448106/TSEL_035404.t1
MGTGVRNASVDGPCHTPTSRVLESALKVPTFGGKPIVSTVLRNKAVSLPLAGTAASPKLHGSVGVLAQQQKRAGGIIKHNTNAVKNLAATQAFSGDNVDEGSSPEPPAKKAEQPAKPTVGVSARGVQQQRTTRDQQPDQEPPAISSPSAMVAPAAETGCK